MQQLYERGYTNLHGVDFSGEMVARGKKQFPHLDLQTGESESLPCPEDSADLIILFAVLTCIPDDGSQESLIRDLKQALKPGGLLYINDFLLNRDERNLNRYARSGLPDSPYGTFSMPDGGIVRHHSPEHLRELVSDFQLIDEEESTFTTMNGHQSRGLSLIVKKMM